MLTSGRDQYLSLLSFGEIELNLSRLPYDTCMGVAPAAAVGCWLLLLAAVPPIDELDEDELMVMEDEDAISCCV